MVRKVEHMPLGQLYSRNGFSFNMPIALGENDSSVISSSRALRLGNLDYLEVIDDTDGGPYKRLANFVRFNWGPNNTTVYIFDHHQFALYGWAEAIKEGKIIPGASLRHWDDHDDAGVASSLEVMTKELFLQGQWSLYEFVRYTHALGCGHFIEPAQRMGMIGEFIHIAPGHEPKIEHRQANAFFTNYLRMSAAYYRRREPEVFDPRRKIVDIDLDYFVSLNLRGRDIAVDIETIRTDIDSAGVVTFATSPGFIRQAKALEFARRILA